MVNPIRHHLRVCFQPHHLARTVAITLVVGTWLTLFNHGDVLIAAGVDGTLWVKIFLNYLTPFVVSNWGLVSRRTSTE